LNLPSLSTSISDPNCQRSEVIQKRATCPQNRETTVLIGEIEESGTHSFLPYGLCRDHGHNVLFVPAWLQTGSRLSTSLSLVRPPLEPADLRFIKFVEQPTSRVVLNPNRPKCFTKSLHIQQVFKCNNRELHYEISRADTTWVVRNARATIRGK